MFDVLFLGLSHTTSQNNDNKHVVTSEYVFEGTPALMSSAKGENEGPGCSDLRRSRRRS